MHSRDGIGSHDRALLAAHTHRERRSMNATALPCSNPSDARRYLLPATMVSLGSSLAPGEWFTLQSFILVRGTSPAYSPRRSGGTAARLILDSTGPTTGSDTATRTGRPWSGRLLHVLT